MGRIANPSYQFRVKGRVPFALRLINRKTIFGHPATSFAGCAFH